MTTHSHPDRQPERLRATLIGFIAILLWATLALFTTATGAVPPFQLLSLTFGIAFAVSLLRWAWLARRDAEAFRRIFRQPWPVWALGIAGLFGYHALYFTALDHAPPVEASLICFLWPLLIVVLSPVLLPGVRLRPAHVLAALLGFGGAAIAIVGGRELSGELAWGYLPALAAAFIWASYSLLTKRVAAFEVMLPTDLLRNVIRQNQMFRLGDLLDSTPSCVSLKKSLATLVQAGTVTAEDARRAAGA